MDLASTGDTSIQWGVAKVCAQCGLKNPDSAVMCDCGLVLRPDVGDKILAGAERAHQERQSRNLAKPIGIGIGVVLLVIVLRLVLKML
jgi:cytolysin (calcineurin-like family phosphatase)